MDNKRAFCFDAIKAFAIFLVLWGHVIQYCGAKEMRQDVIAQIIYSFHMPLFMMVAGFFSVNSMSMKFIPLLKKKSKQLLLPVVGGCLVLMPVTYLISYFIGFGCLITHYWFLKSLFCCYMILWIGIHIPMQIINSNMDKYLLGGVAALLVSRFIEYYNVDIMFPSFLLGFYLSKYQATFLRYPIKILLVSLLAYLIMFHLYYNIQISSISSVCRIMMGLFGSLSCFMFFLTKFKSYRPQNMITSFIGYIGKNTLGIYIIQTILLETIVSYYWTFLIPNALLFSLIVAPLMSAILLVVIILIINVLERYRFTAVLFLGK